VQERREFWSSRLGFILATIGSAIGLGSIWKFPYEVGTNGGGAFVLCYLLGLGVIVFPLMLVEFALGRHGRADAVRSIAAAAAESAASRCWRVVGALGILTAFLILSFYSVIGGWTLAYAVDTISHGLPAGTADDVKARFDALLASPGRMAAYHAVFMALTAFIVARGIAGGIEAACKILMPILMVLLIVLSLYATAQGDLMAALRFLFAVHASDITAKVALEAIGLGFFSIGVGLAIMITYGAYAAEDINLRTVAIATIVGDTVVSCLAGLAVFPIVFAEKLDPAGGPGLMFVTLPLAFARLPLGTLAALAFFLLLAIAGLASAISLLEMPVAYLHQRGWTRATATVIAGLACWLLGWVSVLSFNRWAAWFPLAGIPEFRTATWFDLLDQLTSNMLLPAGGLGLAVLAGWVLTPSLLVDQLRLSRTGAAILRVLLRYVAPCAIVLVALASLRVLWSR
jgi:NSS family neurotransmitter:Na+ symporter